MERLISRSCIALSLLSLQACSTQVDDTATTQDGGADSGQGGAAGADSEGGVDTESGQGGAAGAAGATCSSFGHDGQCDPFCAGGMAGAMNLQPEPPPEGQACPNVGHELCNEGPFPSRHLCTENGWHTIEHVAECTDPHYFDCNYHGAHDGTCCNIEVYCPLFGYCDGVQWHVEPPCEPASGALGAPCGDCGGGNLVLEGCGSPWLTRLDCVNGVLSGPAIARCENWQSPPACDPNGLWHLNYAGLPAQVSGLPTPTEGDFEVGVQYSVLVWFGATQEASLSDDGCHLTMKSIRHYPAGDAGSAIDEVIAVDLTLAGESASGTVEVTRAGAQTEKAIGTVTATRKEP